MGCSVTLLERANLPRYKTCGGALIGASLAALPPGFDLPVREQIETLTFTLLGRKERTIHVGESVEAMVLREEFDTALTKVAVAAGVNVREGTTARRVEVDDEGGTVFVENSDQVQARAVVGADGSASRISSFVGCPVRTVDLALEVEVPMNSIAMRACRGRLLIEWGPIPGSYACCHNRGILRRWSGLHHESGLDNGPGNSLQPKVDAHFQCTSWNVSRRLDLLLTRRPRTRRLPNWPQNHS
jgi:hypothetical protein